MVLGIGFVTRNTVYVLQALGLIDDELRVIDRENAAMRDDETRRQEQARILAEEAARERARRDDRYEYKVEKRKVENFSGETKDWNTWKVKTRSILRGAGLGSIMTDRAYADAHPNKNRVVYSELIGAVADGFGRHHVEDFDEIEDGHGAWCALVAHYERTTEQAPLAEEIKEAMRTLRLHSGTTASVYVNAFKTHKLRLDRIPIEHMSEYEYRNTFIKGIVDPEYNHVKQDLRNALGKDTMTLDAMIDAIIDRERQIRADRKSNTHIKKRPRKVTQVSDDSDEDDMESMKKKIRKLQQELDNKKPMVPTGDKPVTFDIVSNGRILVAPEVWSKLEKPLRDFVVKYNRANQHKDPLPDTPDNVILMKGGERVRRKCNCASGEDEEMEDSPTEPSVAPSTDQPSATLSSSLVAEMPGVAKDVKEPVQPKGVTFGIGRKYRIPTRRTQPSPSADPSPLLYEQGDILIFDTGGGKTPTISSKAWHVIAHTGVSSSFQGYGPGTPVTKCEVVHAITKAYIKGRDNPVFLIIHHASYVTDPDETESLLTLMDLLKNSVEVNGVTPPQYVRGPNKEKTCGITVKGEYFPFEYDEEKLFFAIEKPTPAEIEDNQLDTYELNSRDPQINGIEPVYPIVTRRTQKSYQWQQIPMIEWEKRLGFAPAEVVNKTLAATTQHYMEIEAENRTDPRRHFSKRFKGLQYDRRNEEDATDTIFPSIPSSQGHTCSQFFLGVKSKMWYVVPLKKESQNHHALQDHIRKNGTPRTLRSDNARSETGSDWTQLCWDYKIEQVSSEPHQPNQNPAEPEIGRFSRMVRRNMRAFSVPLGLHNWCQIYCAQINNVTARRSLGWRTPREVAEGHTPDISAHRFHFYEPIWYFRPTIKSPEDNLAKARFLCVADSSGDALTYFILTEPHAGRPQVLIRSVIRSRRKKIGTTLEHINDQPEYERFFFTDDEGRRVVDEEEWSADGPSLDTISGGTNTSRDETNEQKNQDPREVEVLPVSEVADPSEKLPAEVNAGNDLEEEIAGDMMRMDTEDSTFTFEKIVDHRFEDMRLILKVKYRTPTDRQLLMDVPWDILKQDEPTITARYIRMYVKENTRKGKLKEWADTVLKRQKAIVKRLRRMVEKDRKKEDKSKHNNKKKSRNTRWTERPNKEMFGYSIPNTVEEALEMDRKNGNDLWKRAIEKEMKGLYDLNVFKFVDGKQQFDKADGWQRAPLRMIFTVKSEMEDGHHRHKARFVVGGHRLDSSGFNVYSSTVKSLTVRLLLIIAAHLGLATMTADVANAFCTAPNQEKVWADCGHEFGQRSGQRVIIQRALYGMATASRSFHDFLADSLMEIGFTPSRADPDLWIIKSKDHDGYDYVATWVDDLICVAKRPEYYMHLVEQQFKLRNMEHNPKYYLGMDLKRRPDGLLQASAETYVKEAVRKHEKKYGTLAKHNSPMAAEAHPELDDSEILQENEHREFQQIIGVCQWIAQVGRFDIAYAVSSLSRFGSEPRRTHLEMAHRVMGYLKKYPSKGFIVNPADPIFNNKNYVKEVFNEDFGTQYQYFKENLDPRFPKPLVTGLSITFFCDSDHGHDKKTGRSITGVMGFVGSTPVVTKSSRQTCVQTSTFGAELTALKMATEEIIEVRYYLRSMGVLVDKPTWVFVDNEGVVLNVTNPASSLNKKALALAYHFVREHQHGTTIQVRKIGTDDNYSDPMTKALPSYKHHGFFYEMMSN